MALTWSQCHTCSDAILLHKLTCETPEQSQHEPFRWTVHFPQIVSHGCREPLTAYNTLVFSRLAKVRSDLCLREKSMQKIPSLSSPPQEPWCPPPITLRAALCSPVISWVSVCVCVCAHVSMLAFLKWGRSRGSRENKGLSVASPVLRSQEISPVNLTSVSGETLKLLNSLLTCFWSRWGTINIASDNTLIWL